MFMGLCFVVRDLILDEQMRALRTITTGVLLNVALNDIIYTSLIQMKNPITKPAEWSQFLQVWLENIKIS